MRSVVKILVAATLAFPVTGLPAQTGDAADSRTTAAEKLGAREVAALLDMQAMRDAEIVAFLDTDYIHTLENLNDIMGFDTNFDFDDILDQGGALVIDPRTGDFEDRRQDLRLPPHVWTGPYVSYQFNNISIQGEGYDPGTPIDPWGNPYLLFTPLGLARPTLGDVTLQYYGDDFYGYAIVSFAGDGVFSTDDLIVEFGQGLVPSRTVISSLAPNMASPGESVVINGYNFGSVQGDSTVELGGSPLPPSAIVTWTNTGIAFEVPKLASTGEVVVHRGPRVSNAMTLYVFTAARRWMLYR